MKNELEVLRERLNQLIDNDADFDQIYLISLEIDSKLAFFYKKYSFKELENPAKTAV